MDNTCQECKKIVGVKERHTYSHCLIAKAYPERWRDIVEQVQNPINPDKVMEEFDREFPRALGDGMYNKKQLKSFIQKALRGEMK